MTKNEVNRQKSRSGPGCLKTRRPIPFEVVQSRVTLFALVFYGAFKYLAKIVPRHWYWCYNLGWRPVLTRGS